MKLMRWCIRLQWTSPHMKWMNQHRQSHILHHNWLLLVASETGVPLCVGVCHAWDRCTSPNPVKPTPKGSESEITPWVDSGLVTPQHQASKTSLGWINGKFQLLPWMSTRASTEDQWRLQVMCSGSGCLQNCMHLAEGWTSSAHRCHRDSRLNNCHDYSQNWVHSCKMIGGMEMGKYQKCDCSQGC